MKRMLRKIFFYGAVMDRYYRIQDKKANRLKRLELALAELDKWQDIPISQQYRSICKILNIRPNQAAYDFIQMLCLPGVNPYEIVKQLPLE